MLKAEIRQQLVDHYLDFYTLALSMLNDDSDARDAVQEALTRTMARSRVNNPISYCYQTVRHTAIDILRHRRRFVPLDEEMLNRPSTDEDNDSYSSLLEQAMKLHEGMPKAVSALLRLHYQEGLTYEELAKLTGVSRMTIRRQMGKAHKMMNEELRNKKQNEI